MKEEKQKEKVVDRKWLSIIGFIVSIVLLLIAIVLSANEEKLARETRTNKNEVVIEQASSELSKTINEILGNDVSGREVSENVTVNEINSVSSSQGEDAANQGTSSQQDQGTSTQQTQDTSNQQTQMNSEAQVNNNQVNEVKVEEQFIKPVDGEIITGYSMDSLIYSNTLEEWITHRGIDIKAEKTTVVKAAASGTVKYIKEDPRYGLSITIEHSNGFQTIYSSLLSTEFVKEGDVVTQGQTIGTIGNSAVFETADGSHLHFEIVKDGEYVNPDIYIK